MRPRPGRPAPTASWQAAFASVRAIGLTLPGVEATIKYDRTPVLKLDGVFLAGSRCIIPPSPTLVVRYGLEERAWLLDEVPETYYLTDYYRPYPLVLARLSRLGQDALRDLLSVSWRISRAKTRGGRQSRPAGR